MNIECTYFTKSEAYKYIGLPDSEKEQVNSIHIKCSQSSEQLNVNLTEFYNLEKLVINGANIKILSGKWLPSNIQIIELYYTYICEIDTNLRATLPYLNRLYMHTCDNTAIDLMFNDLHLPIWTSSLSIIGCNINKYPSCIAANGFSLLYLDLSENNLKHIPDLASTLPNLRELYINNNRLTALPIVCNSILIYHMHNNLITDLDGKLPYMCTELCAYNNAIQWLPDKLPPNLLRLDISDNSDLDTLPNELPLYLTDLIMDNCQIARLPEFISFKLRAISARNNKLVSINITWPYTLEIINMQDNNITEIPECLADCKYLKNINLAGNPLIKRPIANEFSFAKLPRLVSIILDNTDFETKDIPPAPSLKSVSTGFSDILEIGRQFVNNAMDFIAGNDDMEDSVINSPTALSSINIHPEWP